MTVCFPPGPGYTALSVVLPAVSVKIREATAVIINVRTHLLELSELGGRFKIRSGGGDKYTEQMAAT